MKTAFTVGTIHHPVGARRAVPQAQAEACGYI